MKNLYQQVSIMMKTHHMTEGKIPEFNTVKLHFKNDKQPTLVQYYNKVKNELEDIESNSMAINTLMEYEKREAYINGLILGSIVTGFVAIVAIVSITM